MLRYYVMDALRAFSFVSFRAFGQRGFFLKVRQLGLLVACSAAIHTENFPFGRLTTYSSFLLIPLIWWLFTLHGLCFRKIGCFSKLKLAADIHGSRDALAGRTVTETVLDYNDIRWGVGGRMWITYCIDIVVMKWIHTYSSERELRDLNIVPFVSGVSQQQAEVGCQASACCLISSAIFTSLSNWRFFSSLTLMTLRAYFVH
jgi:hypothetical protein